MVAAFLQAKGEEFGAVDSLAIFAEPLADAVKNAGAGLGHNAIRHGADIEEEIAVPLGATGEHVQDLRLAFPFVVAGMEAPALVHRHTGLPWTPGIRRAEVLLWCGEVARQAVAAVEKDVRLDLADHGVHFLRLPSLGVERPPAVIPEDVDRVVARHQFADACVRGGDEFFVGNRVFKRGDRVGLIIPVVETVVEPDLEPMLARGGYDLCDQITPGCTAVADVEIRECGRVKPESLVVHRREHDIAHAGIHRHATECIGIEILRGEAGGELFVFLQRNLLAVPDPLPAFEKGVEAVVNEETVAGFCEPVVCCHD